VKEAGEEAGVPKTLAESVVPAGTVSFFHKSERGLHPQTEFVFDLELPEIFVPNNIDGEVSEFRLVDLEQVVDIVTSEDYKSTSSPIALDWLIRHGHLSAEVEPDLPEVVELLHLPLHNLYVS